MEIHIVALVLDFDELIEDVVAGNLHLILEQDQHAAVILWRAQTIDTGHAGHDDDITAFLERARRRVAQLVDLVIDRGIFFDVRIGLRDIGLGLVVIVIAHEVFDRIGGKQLFEFGIELGCQRLIGGDHQGWSVDPSDDVGHRKGFAGAGDPEQYLMFAFLLKTLHELSNGVWLVPLRLVSRSKLESVHDVVPTPSFRMQPVANGGMIYLSNVPHPSKSAQACTSPRPCANLWQRHFRAEASSLREKE